MLVLERKEGESFMLYGLAEEPVRVVFIGKRPGCQGCFRIGFDAPASVRILRSELELLDEPKPSA